MKPNQLHDLEHGAVEAAVKETIKPLLEAMLGSLWGHGVRDLNQMTPDDFAPLCTALSDDKAFNDAVKQCFLAYTRAIRLELTNLQG